MRALGPLARPPAPCTMRSDEWVELTTAAALDRVAGAGWSWPMPDGVWTDGAESRLAIDIAVPRGRPFVVEFRFGEDAPESPNARVHCVDADTSPREIGDAFRCRETRPGDEPNQLVT